MGSAGTEPGGNGANGFARLRIVEGGFRSPWTSFTTTGTFTVPTTKGFECLPCTTFAGCSKKEGEDCTRDNDCSSSICTPLLICGFGCRGDRGRGFGSRAARVIGWVW